MRRRQLQSQGQSLAGALALAFALTFALALALVLEGCSHSNTSARAASEKALAPVVATASVDKALISTEDPLTFTVTVNSDPAVQAPLPDIGGRIQGFRITDFGGDDKVEDKRKIVRKWFSLRADVAGSYILPEIEIKYSQDGMEKSAKTSEIFVEVQAPKADSSSDTAGDELRDIKGLEKSPANTVAWLVGMAVALVIAATAYYFYRRKRRAPPPTPRLPAHEDALRRLEELGVPDGIDPVKLKRYYFSLSDIIRSYVEERYGFRATDMTSEEIIRSLKVNPLLPDTERPRFIAFLQETDVVKFTDFRPPSEAVSSARERAKDFVMQTKPVETRVETESVL